MSKKHLYNATTDQHLYFDLKDIETIQVCGQDILITFRDSGNTITLTGVNEIHEVVKFLTGESNE